MNTLNITIFWECFLFYRLDRLLALLVCSCSSQQPLPSMTTVPTVSIGEAEVCSVALEGTSVREPLRHTAATLGIPGKRESGRDLWTWALVSRSVSSQLSGGSHIGELAMIWRVLGILLSAQSDAGALTSLSALVHRDLYGFFAL